MSTVAMMKSLHALMFNDLYLMLVPSYSRLDSRLLLDEPVRRDFFNGLNRTRLTMGCQVTLAQHLLHMYVIGIIDL